MSFNAFSQAEPLIGGPDYMLIAEPNRYFTTACLRMGKGWPKLGTNIQYSDAFWVVTDFIERPQSKFARLEAIWSRYSSFEEYNLCQNSKKPYVSGQNLQDTLNERCLEVKETRAKYDGRPSALKRTL